MLKSDAVKLWEADPEESTPKFLNLFYIHVESVEKEISGSKNFFKSFECPMLSKSSRVEQISPEKRMSYLNVLRSHIYALKLSTLKPHFFLAIAAERCTRQQLLYSSSLKMSNSVKSIRSKNLIYFHSNVLKVNTAATEFSKTNPTYETRRNYITLKKKTNRFEILGLVL